MADLFAECFGPDETATAVYEADGGWSVALYSARPFDRNALRAIVAGAAGKAAAGALTFETIAEKDWAAASLAGLKPVAAGRFVVHGRHDRARIAVNRIGVEIEAALAFGTGHHGTTRGCLLALDRLLKARRPRRILDVGTGTGVLAIAAAKACRRPALAGDIDRHAVAAAQANARTNRVGAFVSAIRADGVSGQRFCARGPYDLVFANILLQSLKRLAHPLARLAAPHGRIVLSGLLPSQVNSALAAYRMQGLGLERLIFIDGWATPVLVRRRRCPVRAKGNAGARYAGDTSTGKSDSPGAIAAGARCP
ncbi:MAG TPA: 50S ribosomal protein L11 methyltransferase [Xanthobacteraceae bacterium]|nr:50S ribosomal protein L11 methyltransferase [Xanthobacteraceae bacterium]